MFSWFDVITNSSAPTCSSFHCCCLDHGFALILLMGHVLIFDRWHLIALIELLKSFGKLLSAFMDLISFQWKKCGKVWTIYIFVMFWFYNADPIVLKLLSLGHQLYFIFKVKFLSLKHVVELHIFILRRKRRNKNPKNLQGLWHLGLNAKKRMANRPTLHPCCSIVLEKGETLCPGHGPQQHLLPSYKEGSLHTRHSFTENTKSFYASLKPLQRCFCTQEEEAHHQSSKPPFVGCGTSCSKPIG
jgi:hypothetical protein